MIELIHWFSEFIFIFSFFFVPEKENEAIIVQLLVQPFGKILCTIWDLVTKPYRKFVKLRSFFQIWKKIQRKKNWKNSYRFWKTNKFIWNEKKIGYVGGVQNLGFRKFKITNIRMGGGQHLEWPNVELPIFRIFENENIESRIIRFFYFRINFLLLRCFKFY